MTSARVLALLVLFAAPAAAQGIANPHGEIAIDCETCHDEGSWRIPERPDGFDHAETSYPLLGGHAGALCRDCHGARVFAHVGIRCADCHVDPHAGELGLDCEHCHDPTGWIEPHGRRARHAETAFPLTGAHAWVDCESCHDDPVSAGYVGTPTDCYACHEADYLATRAPDPAATAYSLDCAPCHGTSAASWGAADIAHSAAFPLTGGHAALDCLTCHQDGYASTPTDCYACHADVYDGTTDPSHLDTGFPLDCAACHRTTAWEPADWDHDDLFPLTGAHTALDCLACHQDGYAGTPTDCYACHAGDYDFTTDPSHLAAGFPLDCTDCHGTTAWEPADWDHDALFPIYGGTHREEWTSCTDCHLEPTDFGEFECIFCHDHNQTDTDDDHDEVEFYDYISVRCLECHPGGTK